VPIPELMMCFGGGAVYSGCTRMVIGVGSVWFPHSTIVETLAGMAIFALGVKLRWRPPWG